MRKKLMTAMMVWAGLGVVAGCTPRDEVPEQRAELIEERQEAQQERAEIRQETQQEIAEERREAQEELAGVRQDVQESREDLAQAMEEQEREVQGQVRTASPNAVVLVVPAQGGREMSFQAGAQTQVMRGEREISITDLQPGDSVRASYMITEQGNLVLSDVEVQQPGQQMQQQQQQPEPMR